MLQTLKITNFAIIKEALIDFEQGFNILTGETGAGKSMVVDAISLLLGARSSIDEIRSGESEAAIEGIFSFKKNDRLKKSLSGLGIKNLDDELTVRRIISREGKNKIYINGQFSTQAQLYELGRNLVDICAQNENRFLMNPLYHVEVLDEYGSLLELRGNFKDLFGQYSDISKRKMNLLEKCKEAGEKADFLKFLVKEIGELNLKEGEDEELKSLRKRLQNSERIKDLANRTYEILYSCDGALVEGLKKASKDLSNLKNLDPSFKKSPEEIDVITGQLSDFAFELKGYIEELDFEPGKLDEVEDRLDKISRISRKYGSVTEAIERAENAKDELKLLENFEPEMKLILEEEKILKEKIKITGRELSRERKKAAQRMDEEINRELKSLSMEKALFKTQISPFSIDQKRKDLLEADDMIISLRGTDGVQFFISTNPGEEPKPLENIASLGELSRVMLALKGIFYLKNRSMETFIFDEIDTGIGGKVAEMVGRKLKMLSVGKEVICVTHLPQIASFADNHILIKKNVSGGRTFFNVSTLRGEARKEEIARMLGGLVVTEKTRALAEELLSKSGKEVNI